MIVVIVVVGIFFLLMGGYALAAPAALVRPFGLVADGPESRSEVRAASAGSAWRSRPCSDWPWPSPGSASAWC